MSRCRTRLALTATFAVTGVGLLGGPAAATVHEITASYCSGGGVGNFEGNAVTPPGVSDPNRKNFAQPVLASGAVAPPPTLTTTDAPQVKVKEGLFAPTLELDTTTIDHPSEHCRALQP